MSAFFKTAIDEYPASPSYIFWGLDQDFPLSEL